MAGDVTNVTGCECCRVLTWQGMNVAGYRRGGERIQRGTNVAGCKCGGVQMWWGTNVMGNDHGRV